MLSKSIITFKCDMGSSQVEFKEQDEEDGKEDAAEKQAADEQEDDDEKAVAPVDDSEAVSPEPRNKKNLRALQTSPKRGAQSSVSVPQATYSKLMIKSEKKQLLSLLSEEEPKPKNEFEAKYKHQKFIIQKYIERPLLLNQRKFDIRVWVFLDSRGQAYFCRQGYLRTSSYKFELDPDDPDNRFVHLTNNAVQKFSKSFGSHEDGNILSFARWD